MTGRAIMTGKAMIEELRKSKSGVDLAKSLIEHVSNENCDLDQEEAEQLLREAAELLEGSEDAESGRLLISVYRKIASHLYHKSMLREELLFTKLWLDKATELRMFESACEALNTQAIAYRYLYMYRETFFTYQRGILLAREIGYRKLEAKMLFNTGEVLSVFRSTQADSLDYMNRAEKIYRETNNMRGLSYVLSKKARNAKIKGDLSEARLLFSRCLKIRRKHGTPPEVIRSTVFYADLLEGPSNQTRKVEILREVLHQAEKVCPMSDFLYYSKYLITALMESGQYDEADKLISRSIRMSEGLSGFLDMRKALWSQRYELSKAMGNTREAVAALEEVVELNEQLGKTGLEKELKAFIAKRELDYLDAEKALLKVKNEELLEVNNRLQRAMDKITSLRSMLPICAGCGKVRDDSGYWRELQSLLAEASMAGLSHSLCSSCYEKLYGDADD